MVKKKDESAGERRSARKTKDRRRGQSRLKGKAKRQYPLELRLQAIREVEEQDRSQEEVARALGMSKATLCVWLRAYRSGGVAALESPRTGARAQRKKKADAKSQAHREAVLQTKEAHPQAGTRRIRDLLRRFEAIGVSEQDVRRILHEAGLISRAPASVARPQPERRFERAQPNVSVPRRASSRGSPGMLARMHG